MSLFAAEPAKPAVARPPARAEEQQRPTQDRRLPAWAEVKALIDAAVAAGTHAAEQLDLEGEWVVIVPPPRHVGPAPRNGGPCQVCGRSAAAAECQTCGRAMCAAHFERHTHTLASLPSGWTGTPAAS